LWLHLAGGSGGRQHAANDNPASAELSALAAMLQKRTEERREVRVPTEAYATATAYLADTLDWHNQWHQIESDGIDEDFRPAPRDHLYPHL
jgi:hypothetical protein